MWIDYTEPVDVDDVVFVASVLDTSNGGERYRYSLSPYRTNQSHEPRLTGWCGETNNRSVTAEGLFRVVKIAGNYNERLQLKRVPAAELSAELMQLGYPEMAL